MRFTTQQIRRWLEGWYYVDEKGVIEGDVGLKTILMLLDDDQDGIEAMTKQSAHNCAQSPLLGDESDGSHTSATD